MMDLLLLTVMAAIILPITDAGHIVDAGQRYHDANTGSHRFNRIPSFRTMLSLTDDIDIKPCGDSFTTAQGSVIGKFRETFRGLPVIGGSIEADIDEQGVYQGGLIGGKLVVDIHHDVQNIFCKFSRTKAIALVLEKEGLVTSNIDKVKVMPRRICVDESGIAHLSIIVDMLVKTDQGPRAPYYYIDMCDGTVVKHFNSIRSNTFGSTGTTGSFGTGTTGSFGTGSTIAFGTGQTGSFGTGSTGAFGTGSTGAFGTGSTGAFGTGSTGAFGTGSTGAFGTGSTGAFGTGSTGAFGTGSTGAFGTGSTGAFGTGSTGAFGTGSTGAFGTGSTGAFGTGSTGAFGTGSTGAFGTGSTGAFGTGSTGAFGTGSTGAFGTGQTGSFGTGSTGSFGTGSTGAFVTGSTGSVGTSQTGNTVTNPSSAQTAGTTQSVTPEATPKPTQQPVSCGFAAGVGGNLKTGKYSYGKTPRCLTPRVVDKQCFMENEHCLTVDLKTSTDTSIRTVIEFQCSVGYQDEVNDGYSPATDAFFYGTLSQRMLKEWYGVTPLPKVAMLVHYDTKLDNAFYYNSAVMFGDGDTMFYPLTNYDTVAHELGHGVTEKYSNLEYSAQSGGMNEAFSDIMGEAAEHFFTGNDWLSGMEDTKDPKKPLRYFEKPSLDGSSIDHVKDYYTGIDVHLSSGVYNRAFYQIIKVQGVPMRYGFEAFLTANRMYWGVNSNFVDGACGVMKAAYDLGLDTEKFKAGFKVVGIATCDITSSLQILTTTKPRSNLKVTNTKQPLFGIKLKSSDKVITLTTTGGQDVKMAISTSLSRDAPVATGGNSVTWTTEGKSGIVYVRLYTDGNAEAIGVGLSLTVQ